MVLAASSAVSFSIISASLRLVVIWTGSDQSSARRQGREQRRGSLLQEV